MNDPDPLAEIRQRRAVITPPPWEWDLHGISGPFRLEQKLERNLQGEVILKAPESWASDEPSDEDAEFIAHAPEDIDWLIAEVERLENMLADCRKHRDRAEQNERRLFNFMAQIRQLTSDEYGE